MGVLIAAIVVPLLVYGIYGKDNDTFAEQIGALLFSKWGRLAVPVAALLVFALIPSPLPLLGDATLYGGHMWRVATLGADVPAGREPLSMFLLQWIFRAQMRMNISDVCAPFGLFGAVSGSIFIAGAMALAADIHGSNGRRLFTVALLLSCAGSIFFFGYVESYALQYATVAWLLWACIRTVNRNGNSLLPAALWCIACALHYQNVLLLPALITTYALASTRWKRTQQQRLRIIVQAVAIAIPVLLSIYAYFQIHPIAQLISEDNPFIPFLNSGELRYTLLSWQHIADLANEHLLLAPISLALIAAFLLTRRRKIQWTSPAFVILAVALLGVDSFLIGGYFMNGIARDWDIAAVIGIILTIGCALCIEQSGKPSADEGRARTLITAVAATGFLVWLGVNMSDESAITRYADILNLYRGKVSNQVTRYGYENLRKYEVKKQLWLQELLTDRAMLGVLPWHLDLHRAMAIAEARQGELGRDASVILSAILDTLVHKESDSTLTSEGAGDKGKVRIAPPGAGDPSSLGDLICLANDQLVQNYRFFSYPEGLMRADTIIALHPRLPYGYELRGWLAMQNRDLAMAQVHIRQAIARNPMRARPVIHLASIYLALGLRDSVRHYAVRGLELDPGYIAGLRALTMSMRDTALSLADTTDLERIVGGCDICLAQATDRHLSTPDIEEVNVMKRDALQADVHVRRKFASVAAAPTAP
jgi:hypothetical protein